MPRVARPEATAAMKGCVIPAPAPWASTKQARALTGRSSSADTVPAVPTAISSFCGLTVFMIPDRNV